MLITAAATPLNRDYSIDFESFTRLLEKQQKFVDAVLVAGTTGQGTLLNHAEKNLLLDVARDFSFKKGICVSDVSFERVMENIRLCAHKSVDFLLVTPPFFVRPQGLAIKNFFKKILDASSVPVIIYNNPSRVAVHIDETVLQSLEGHPMLLGIKESSQKKSIGQIPINVFCGDDDQIANYKAQNAFGAISVLSNAFPLQLAQGWRGSVEDLEYIQKLVQTFVGVNPLPIHYILHKQGLFKTDLVKEEIGELSKEQKWMIDRILEEVCLKLV
jgi:4-hydroxy-tetrahydrodipicolinate synthase